MENYNQNTFYEKNLLSITEKKLFFLKITIEIQLERTNFSFVNYYQLKIASELVMGACVYFSQCWDPSPTDSCSLVHKTRLWSV